MKIRSTTYHVESSIPGIKSWGYLPEHEGLSLKRAREVRARFREHKMRTRIVRTQVAVVG